MLEKVMKPDIKSELNQMVQKTLTRIESITKLEISKKRSCSEKNSVSSLRD